MNESTKRHRRKFFPSQLAERSTKTTIIVTVGLLAALLAGSLATREARWIIYFSGAVIAALTFLVASRKRLLLETVFILSLQFDVSYRIFYGYAGSAGIAFPLAVLTGGALAASILFLPNKTSIRAPLAGRLGPLIAAYFVVSVVSLLATSEQFVGVSHLVFQLELFFVYWLGLTIVRDRDSLDRVVQLLILTLVIQSAVYIVQHALGISFSLIGEVTQRGAIPRPGGTVGTTPAGFASFILPILLLTMTTSLETPSRTRSAMLTTVALFGFLALALTLTRAAYGSFALGSLVIVWLSYRHGLIQPRRVLYIACGATVITLMCLPMISARLASAPISASYQERAGLMKVALHIIELNPWTGLGPGAYAHTYSRYIPETLPTQWLSVVHNAYLLRTAETGIFGGITLIALLIASVRLGIRASRTADLHLRWIAIGLTAGVLALSFEMYWDHWQGFTYNAMLWFVFGLLETTHRLSTRSDLRPPTADLDRLRTGAHQSTRRTRDGSVRR